MLQLRKMSNSSRHCCPKSCYIVTLIFEPTSKCICQDLDQKLFMADPMRLANVVCDFRVLQAPNQWTPQLVSMMFIAYARNNCVSLPACQRLLTALTNEALQQIDATDCQVIHPTVHMSSSRCKPGVCLFRLPL